MATEAQILTNRRNAQKTTGPRTLSMILGAPGDLFMQNKANFRKAKMNENLFAAKDYENETAFRLQKYKPKQSQFQTGHLLVNRMKPKLLDFHPKNSLTAWLNSVKYHFLCSEREYFYEELYGKKRTGRAEVAAR